MKIRVKNKVCQFFGPPCISVALKNVLFIEVGLVRNIK